MSVDLFPDTLVNRFTDNVVMVAKKEVIHRFNNKINSGYYTVQCTRVFNTASLSEDQTVIWQQLVILEPFLCEGAEFVLTGMSLLEFSTGFCIPCSPYLAVSTGMESLNALFEIMVSHKTLSLHFIAKEIRQFLKFLGFTYLSMYPIIHK